MKIYRIISAQVEDAHGHVTGLRVRKWRPNKKGYGKRKEFSKERVIEKIDDGAIFRTKSRDGTGSVTLTYEPCGMDNCPEIVLRTIDAHSIRDDLDYMREK